MADFDIQPDDSQDERQRLLGPIAAPNAVPVRPDAQTAPLVAPPTAAAPTDASPIAPKPVVATPVAAPTSAAPVAAAPVQQAPIAKVAPPQPHEGFLENLYNRESNIKNPLLRTLAKVGTGIGRGVEGIASPFVPELSFVPGTELNAIAQNRRDAAAQAEAAKEKVAQENAESERVRAENPPEVATIRAQADAAKESSKEAAAAQAKKEDEEFKTNAAKEHEQFLTDMEQKKTAATPFEQWASNPEVYDAYLKAQATAKQNGKGTVMSPYAAVKLADYAYMYDPRLLPYAQAAMKNVADQLGMKLPEGIDISTPPAGMATLNGEALGYRSHLNPTATTESQAQMADKLLNELPRVQKEVSDLAPKLGPIPGRVITGFLAGGVGTTGDPKLDEALGTLRTDWPLLMSATSKMHIGTQKAIEDLEKTNSVSGSSAKILTGFLDSVGKWAKQAQTEGRDINAPRAGGTSRFSVNGKTYNIPADKVGQFKKQFPKAQQQ